MSSQKIDLSEYIGMFLLHTDDTYKQTVVDNVKDAFFSYNLHFGSVSISYFQIFVLLIAVLFVVLKVQGKSYFLVCIMAIQTLLYSLFIGVLYVYRLSEQEAQQLASYQRYMNIVFMALWIVVIYVLIDYLENIKGGLVLFLVSIVLIVSSPVGAIENAISRDNVRVSHDVRSPYEALTNKLEKECKEDDKIYFISRGDNDFSYLVVRYIMRPIDIVVPYPSGYDLGPAFSDEDADSYEISPDEWLEYLMNEGYTYVAVYTAGDMVDNYGSLFTASDVEDSTLYKLDYDKRLLIKCDN